MILYDELAAAVHGNERGEDLYGPYNVIARLVHRNHRSREIVLAELGKLSDALYAEGRHPDAEQVIRVITRWQLPPGRDLETESTLSVEELISIALQDSEPSARVHETVYWLVHGRGMDRVELEAELRALAEPHFEAGRTREEDAIMDAVGDMLGWCAPRYRI